MLNNDQLDLGDDNSDEPTYGTGPLPPKRRPSIDDVPLKKNEDRITKREQLIDQALIVEHLLTLWDEHNNRLPRGKGKWAREVFHCNSRETVRQLLLRCKAYRLFYPGFEEFAA